MPAPKDVTGMRFGSLRALRHVIMKVPKGRGWICLCDCGDECIVMATNLYSGRTKSCGCRRRRT